MPNKRQVAGKLRVGRNGMMMIRIHSVVDGNAIGGAQPKIVIDDRLPTTVGKNKIVLRDRSQERIAVVLLNAGKRCRRIDVPKGYPRARRLAFQHSLLE